MEAPMARSKLFSFGAGYRGEIEIQIKLKNSFEQSHILISTEMNITHTMDERENMFALVSLEKVNSVLAKTSQRSCQFANILSRHGKICAR